MGASEAHNPVLSAQPLLPLVLVALLVVAVAPVLRSLYPILYVIGEDWSYPGVGAVGLVLYCAPLLAAFAWRAGPRAGVIAGVVLVAVGVVAVLAADPISRWAAGAATVLSLAGVTLVLDRLAAVGISRHWLFASLLVGLTVDTAIRGATYTWDLVWHPGVAWALVAAVPAIAALVVGWILASRLEGPSRTSSARFPAVLGLGGFVALQVLFLQAPGFVSSVGSIPFWLGVLVVLVGDATALAALILAPRVLSSRGLAVAVAVGAALAVVAVAVVTGVATVVAVLAAQVAVSLALGVAFLGEVKEPARARPVAGPAKAAAAATFALVLIFLWQFYIDTALPFPRWVIALVGASAVGLAAVRASRPSSSPATLPELRRPLAALVAGALGLAVVVPVGLWLTRPSTVVTTASSPTVRVMTYNIRSAADTDGQVRPDVIADVIRSFGPDVVVLQEVGRGWAIHAGTDVAAYLENDLGLTALFVGSADDQFGNLVLSRLPMTTVGTGILPDVGGQRRSYAAARIDVAGKPLLVVGSHLEDRSAPQIQALRAVVGSTTPAVIAGDLNLHPDEPEVAELAGLVDVVEATGDRCRATSAQPIRACDRPDWILLTTGLEVSSVAIGTVPASDHLPLVATLTLTG
ncbi:MAG TPA: endonuclease/exonuclease/phosphatase family protein [Candidatus Nanopelagicales bacterium]